MKRRLKQLSAPVISVFLPDRCRLCGEVIFTGDTLCAECENALRPEGELCRKCGLPVQDCKCEEYKFKCNYSAFAAPFYLKNSIAKGVVRFKNYGFTELAQAYAEEIVKCASERFDGARFDCVVSVPVQKLRRIKRGYNQSELLARAVAERLAVPYEDLLMKVRKTKSQRGISAKERMANLKGAFDLAPDKDAEGKTILIVDDIKTTGSTLSECALTLKAYGAKEVFAASVAVAYDKKR